MDVLRLLLGVVLPYVAVAVFIGGMIYRVNIWRKLPAPAMTLFPAPASPGATTVNTVQEALFFKSLFQGDRVLWTAAWIFHAVLALIFLGHFRVVANVDTILMAMGMSEENIKAMSGGVGGAAGIVIFAAVVFLILRRASLPRVREISGAGDYLALLLIAAILLTGNMMRFSAEHLDLALTRDYFMGLATFSVGASSAALQHGTFLIHMALAFLLMIVIPFSKILHFGGIFFTHQLIRKS